MSIRDIRDAFRNEVGDRASVLSATMGYVRHDDGEEAQVLTFLVQKNGAYPTPFTFKIARGVDPVTGARDAALAYLKSIEGT